MRPFPLHLLSTCHAMNPNRQAQRPQEKKKKPKRIYKYYEQICAYNGNYLVIFKM